MKKTIESGSYIIKKLGLRVVYRLIIEDGVMKIIVISARAEDEVYITAQITVNNPVYTCT